MGETESLFIKDTISYRLIDLIFHEQGYSLADLADIFYVSTSTIYRKLKNLAEYFNENGLTLNMNNFVISGPEHAIREFFYRFYWSVIKSSQYHLNQFHLKKS
ncbi:helix-turn-helix domain-containing protein [Enterococcus termitis]